MNDFRARFTKWYCRKGYRMMYKPCDYGDGVAEMIFQCPFWVRPLVYMFFSPCVYYHEIGYSVGQGFEEGLSATCSNLD